MYDAVITNGLLYRDGELLKTNLYFQEGLVAEISESSLPTKKSYDAKGKWVLPGLIDPHTHFALQVGSSYSRDNFYEGSLLAAYGGVTTYIDFLQPVRSLRELAPALSERKEAAKASVLDYSFHTTIAGFNDSLETLVEWMLDEGLPSLKLFTTYRSTNRQTSDALIARLLTLSKSKGFRVLVHAENDAMIDESEGASVSQHATRRPALSEISEVLKLAAMCEYSKGKLYIVHTNCGSTLAMLSQKYGKLLASYQMVIESAPHYLCMDSSLYEKEEGYRYVMTPPLRSAKELELLKTHFNHIHLFGTDHCPYTEEQKCKETLDSLPNGIEGEPYMFPALFKLFGKAVIPKLTSESAKIHGLGSKGSLEPGKDADCIIFDPEKEWSLSHCDKDSLAWNRELKRKYQPSPYEHVPLQGELISTFCAGEPLIEEGRFYAREGRFLKREGVGS